MKKNSIIGAGLITLAATFALTGCNKSAPEEKTNTQATEIPAGGLKIAYVEIDTLMSQYNFCKDYTLLMNKREKTSGLHWPAKNALFRLKPQSCKRNMKPTSSPPKNKWNRLK